MKKGSEKLMFAQRGLGTTLLLGGLWLHFVVNERGFSQEDHDFSIDEQESETKSEDGEAKKKWDSEKLKKFKAEDISSSVKIEDVAETKGEYHYAALNKEDPFVPPLLMTKPEKQVEFYPEEIPVISPLQKYLWNSLKVVGIWRIPSGEQKALVMTPDQVGVIARVGDAFGNSGGKIVDVTNNSIIVREYRMLPDGTREFEDRIINLGTMNTQELDDKRRQPIVIKAQKGADRNSSHENNTDFEHPATPLGPDIIPENMKLLPSLNPNTTLPPPLADPVVAPPINQPAVAIAPVGGAGSSSTTLAPQVLPPPVAVNTQQAPSAAGTTSEGQGQSSKNNSSLFPLNLPTGQK